MIARYLLIAAALLMALVQFTAHEGPRKDWLSIVLGAIVLVLAITSFVLARRDTRSRSGRTH